MIVISVGSLSTPGPCVASIRRVSSSSAGSTYFSTDQPVWDGSGMGSLPAPRHQIPVMCPLWALEDGRSPEFLGNAAREGLVGLPRTRIKYLGSRFIISSGYIWDSRCGMFPVARGMIAKVLVG